VRTSRLAWLSIAFVSLACGSDPPPPARPLPVASAPTAEAPHAPACSVTISDTDLRSKEGAKILDELVKRIRLGPEDEALRNPKSIEDVRKILRRDTVYLFPAAAAFARSLNSKEGRQSEATFELVMGESQLVGAQVLRQQEAWVGSDLRMARATLASEPGPPTTDRNRLLAQLIKVVDDGTAIGAALAATAPAHVARGAEVVRALKSEAPNEPQTGTLLAEYHRLRGEWNEFDGAMQVAESAGDKERPALRYLRAMEQIERYHRRDEGAQMMRDALKAHPKFVRAQAALVLMAPNPRAALRELQKLKGMNEDHYLVMLLEPTLSADQELGRIENATGQGGGDAK
jgi:hypothetical protein